MQRIWNKRCWCCLALVLFGSGCSKSDPEVLAGIGRKLADRTNLVSGGLEQAWSKVTGRLLLEGRVKGRLRWEKGLADLNIEVHAIDNAVELKGTVANPEQVRRAVELAEATLGVEKVINSLQVDRPQ